MVKVTRLHQIEMSSRCNLRCVYCPSPHLGRPKVDMEEDHFRKSIAWAKIFHERGDQKELNLAGIGESTLHPRFMEFVSLARDTIPDISIVITTNGILVDETMAKFFRSEKIEVFVSLHRPEKAGPAVDLLQAAGVLKGVSADPSISAIDWAGQVKWHKSCPTDLGCPWLHDGMVMVMADGRITRCCLDAYARGILGTIDDDLFIMETSPYILCKSCHLSTDCNLDVDLPDTLADSKHVAV